LMLWVSSSLIIVKMSVVLSMVFKLLF
jgi:hypothetical protein